MKRHLAELKSDNAQQQQHTPIFLKKSRFLSTPVGGLAFFHDDQQVKNISSVSEGSSSVSTRGAFSAARHGCHALMRLLHCTGGHAGLRAALGHGSWNNRAAAGRVHAQHTDCRADVAGESTTLHVQLQMSCLSL